MCACGGCKPKEPPNPYASVMQTPAIVRDANGIPDPYATALNRRRVQEEASREQHRDH